MITQTVKDKLAEAVELWADDNLLGRPALLAHMVYLDVVKALEEKAEEIDRIFPKEADHAQ